LYTFLISAMCATYPVHLVLDMRTLILFAGACKLRSSLLCSLFESPAASSFLDQRSFLTHHHVLGMQRGNTVKKSKAVPVL
jgi:hypothetical protein